MIGDSDDIWKWRFSARQGRGDRKIFKLLMTETKGRVWGVIAIFVAAWASNVAIAATPDLNKSVRPLLEDHCYDCHDSDVKKGGLDLSSLKIDLANSKNAARWAKIYDRIALGEMPPPKKPRPPKKLLVSTQLDEKCYAGPAVAGGVMYIRTTSKLYSLGGKVAK